MRPPARSVDGVPEVRDPFDPHDWLTQRAAAQVLHEDLGIHPETARRLLVAGVLGRPRRTSLAAFHHRDAVDAFVARCREQDPLPVPDRNLVVVRVGNARVAYGATEQHQLDRLADGWRMSPTWRALCRGVVEAGLPPVVTRFDLRAPGEWYDDWRGRLLPTGAGGAALRFWALGMRPPWERATRNRAPWRPVLG